MKKSLLHISIYWVLIVFLTSCSQTVSRNIQSGESTVSEKVTKNENLQEEKNISLPLDKQYENGVIAFKYPSKYYENLENSSNTGILAQDTLITENDNKIHISWGKNIELGMDIMYHANVYTDADIFWALIPRLENPECIWSKIMQNQLNNDLVELKVDFKSTGESVCNINWVQKNLFFPKQWILIEINWGQAWMFIPDNLFNVTRVEESLREKIINEFLQSFRAVK